MRSSAIEAFDEQRGVVDWDRNRWTPFLRRGLRTATGLKEKRQTLPQRHKIAHLVCIVILTWSSGLAGFYAAGLS